MKINELLKPNERFSPNEAQVAGNRCRFHIHSGAGLRNFRALLLPLQPPAAPPPSQPVALPLVFTHAFPGVAVSPGLADGNVPVSSVFIGWGEHGKRNRASSVVPPRAEDLPPPVHRNQRYHIQPLARWTCEEIMMSERWGSTFAASLHGKNFKPKWQSILLGKSMQRNFSTDIHYTQSSWTAILSGKQYFWYMSKYTVSVFMWLQLWTIASNPLLID